MNLLLKQGKIDQGKSENIPMKKHYLMESKGVELQSIWNELTSFNSIKNQKVGYPTQKPIALLERIIKASCPEDGLVLDPFCRCAITCVDSERLARQ